MDAEVIIFVLGLIAYIISRRVGVNGKVAGLADLDKFFDNDGENDKNEN